MKSCQLVACFKTTHCWQLPWSKHCKLAINYCNHWTQTSYLNGWKVKLPRGAPLGINAVLQYSWWKAIIPCSPRAMRWFMLCSREGVSVHSSSDTYKDVPIVTPKSGTCSTVKSRLRLRIAFRLSSFANWPTNLIKCLTIWDATYLQNNPYRHKVHMLW